MELADHRVTSLVHCDRVGLTGVRWELVERICTASMGGTLDVYVYQSMNEQRVSKYKS